MYTNDSVKYDIFISYEHSNQQDILRFSDYLRVKHKFKVFFDMDDVNSGEPLGKTLLTALDNSKVFVCFITKRYANSRNCQDEFNWAFIKRQQPTIIVMLERIGDFSELGEIGFRIFRQIRINLFKDVDVFQTFSGPEFDKLIRSIYKYFDISFERETGSSSNVNNEHFEQESDQAPRRSKDNKK
jgi:hypothetical protein